MQKIEMKLYHINLTEEEREELVRLATTGRHAARKVMRARILLKADEGLKDEQIAEHLDVNVRTVEKARKQCAIEGVEATLTPKARPPGKPRLDGEGEARLVQLACSAPPDGRQRWTLHLLADKLVELDVVDAVSHETVRQLLKKRIETLANTAVLYPPGTKRRVRCGDGRRARGLPATV
jgi:transposase